MSRASSARADRAPLAAAVCQFRGGPDVGANLRRIEELAAEAAGAGARLVVFPEASMYAWDSTADELAAAAAEHSASFLDGLSAVASQLQVTLVAGMFVPTNSPRPHNRLVVLGPDGELRASYDKVHLFDAFSWRESDKITPGRTRADMSELCTVDVDGLTIGLLNCYDLRFPEMARALVDRGVEVLIVSSAWVAGPHKEMHWEILLRARAIENTCYVLAASQPPPAAAGLSMIVDPVGVVAATCVGVEGTAAHRLDPAHLRHARETVPSLQHRRYAVATAYDGRRVTSLSRIAGS
ncbi:MAG: hydrolase [Pseudonocardia sp.]|nr:hydrolase [Pseudonocardia sp.]